MQNVTISVDVKAAMANAKLDELNIKADKLRQVKATIKTDINGNDIAKVVKLSDGIGGVVTQSEKWLKNGKKVTQITAQTGDAAKRSSEQFTLLNTVLLRLAHTGITVVTRAFRDAFTEMKNVDSELVVVRKVSNASAEELEKLRDRAYEVGAAYGVAASDYLSAAAEMTRAGYRESAGDLAELATKLQLVGDVSQDTANQFLIATDKAYQMNGDMKKLGDTIDKLNEIDNNYATSIQKVADGIGILAPIASQTHVSFEQMASALGTITAVTQRSGAESARALRSLFLNIAKDTKTEIEDGVTWTVEEINNVQDALKKYAPEVVRAAEATGQLINPMEAIGALAKSFEEGILTEQELMTIVSGLGGKLRSSQLLALIQNWDMYNEMLKTTAEAAGSADKEVQNALDSWQVKLQQLKNVFTQFVANTIDVETIKKILDGVNSLVTAFGKLGKVLLQVGAAFVGFKVITSFIKLFKTMSAVTNVTGSAFKGFLLTLTNYKTVSSAAGAGTQALTASISGISVAASAATAAVGVLTAALTAGILIYNKAKQAEAEREERIKERQRLEREEREASVEKARQAAQEGNELLELKERYESLKKEFEDGKGGREEYLSAQKEIIKKLKDEGEAVSVTAGKYDELATSIDAATTKVLEQKKAEQLYSYKTKVQSFYDSLEDKRESLDLGTLLLFYGKELNIDNSLQRHQLEDPLIGTWIKKNIVNKYANLNYEDVLDLYDKLVESRDWAYKTGMTQIGRTSSNNDYGIFDSQNYLTPSEIQDAISELEPLVSQYRQDLNEWFSLLDDYELNKLSKEFPELSGEIARFKNEVKNAESIESIVDGADETEEKLEGLSEKLDKATKSLEGYKKALDGGEKGDTLKSYAKAYQSAIEMLDKGMTGSNAYKSAVDLLIPKSVMRQLHYDYEAAGEILGSDFYRALFEGGGDDFGANAANFIRKGIESGLYEGVKIIEDETTGTFSVAITDMDAFARSVNISEDALWAWLDALDVFDSQKLYTNEELKDLIDGFKELDGVVTETGDGIQQINLTNLLKALIQDGKTEEEIYGIIDALHTLASSDPDVELIEPSNIEETIDLLTDANKQVEDYNDKHLDQQEITLTSNADEFFGDIYDQIELLNGQTIYLKIKPKTYNIAEYSDEPFLQRLFERKKPSSGGKSFLEFWGLDGYANGTKYAAGGLSLVNDGGGAELISANGKAWIAGGGEPTITNLPSGATVFNAKQTREILSRSGIPAFDGGTAGGIPEDHKDKPDKKGSSGGSPKDKLDDLLNELDEYIEKLLKKAKDALNAQLEAIDAQIEALQQEHNAEEDKNKLEELRLKILEAEKKLTEAQNERTVRYFNKQTGQWEWMADQKAVADAQKALQDAQEAYDKEVAEQEYQAQIQALKDEKDSLQETYNQLADHWQEIYDALKESNEGKVDIADLLKRLGIASDTKGDIKELIEEIQSYESELASGSYTIPLDSKSKSALMNSFVSSDGSGFLSKAFGISKADINAKGSSLYSKTSSSIVGDTYYINGIKIGSDMINRPLSQILSVLPIYAN